MISRSTIDRVYETARVEEVIGDFVNLKKSGSNFKGLSPFTDERTPSFMVSPVKQIWKDFSSGKGGNVVAFLMEHEHFTYPEAIRYLAKKYQIEIEETQQTDQEKEKASERESMMLVTEFASSYYEKTLWESEQGKAIGLSYFKERGFSDQTIRTFALGYNPDSWDALTNAALEEGYQLEFLEKTGLTIVKDPREPGGETRKFDRFKGRVMFPIRSLSGRILGFGGRTLSSDKKVAKYLNSPESDIYHKSKVLYGIYLAKKAIAKEDVCYLVEGYTDVIQMHQSGIENVVASSGTALTPEQIRLIRRLTSNIVVLFDGDAAGLRASLRGIDLILEEGMNVRVCSFPEGEDPDSFARKNTREGIEAYLAENAQDFIQFKTTLLTREAANDPIKRAETIRDIVSSISRIPDRIKREVYIQECASLMNISEDVLFNTLAQMGRKQQQEAARKPAPQPPMEVMRTAQADKVSVHDVHEREILKILLQYGSEKVQFTEYVQTENSEGELELMPREEQRTVSEKIFLDLQEDEIEFSNPKFRNLYAELIRELVNNEAFRVDSWIKGLDEEQGALVSDLIMQETLHELHGWERKDIYVKPKEADIELRLTQTVLSMRMQLIHDLISEMTQKGEEEQPALEVEDLIQVKDYIGLKTRLAQYNDLVIKEFQ
ncbi:DNA primase [Robiginitalea myxolifaciens]|uniref:DNA primase n=1 Tax=Robiginitalea myxolifaciens TaxID=400055 RepID=A0A1I6FR61_9FLAO|nr:DNA primase [Robiginitalea myxolifaciens]SFR32452.1 DNA primase [Robiginitalea myxolifaciens]